MNTILAYKVNTSTQASLQLPGAQAHIADTARLVADAGAPVGGNAPAELRLGATRTGGLPMDCVIASVKSYDGVNGDLP